MSVETNDDGPDATDFSMPVDAYIAQSELAVPAYVRVISGCKDSELAADVGSTKKFDVVRTCVLQVTPSFTNDDARLRTQMEQVARVQVPCWQASITPKKRSS